MNYQKIDPALNSALTHSTLFTVFIHTNYPITINENTILQQLGINVSLGETLFTATISTPIIQKLSNQSFVKWINLSHNLKLYPK